MFVKFDLSGMFFSKASFHDESGATDSRKLLKHSTELRKRHFSHHIVIRFIVNMSAGLRRGTSILFPLK